MYKNSHYFVSYVPKNCDMAYVCNTQKISFEHFLSDWEEIYSQYGCGCILDSNPFSKCASKMLKILI